MERRTFLGLLAVGAASLAAGGSGVIPPVRRAISHPAAVQDPLPRPVTFAGTATPTPTPTAPAGIPVYAPPVYQQPHVVSGQWDTDQLALDQLAITIDDGFDPDVVAAYVQLCQDTGMHITFSPNGCYAEDWSPHADVLRPLIESGQVQIANHTYSHQDLTKLSTSQIQEEAERNEQWINKTFGTSSRPYLRPPFGFHDERVREAVAESGFHQVLMWNGSLGDAAVLTPQVLMQQARLWVKAGTVLLGHANHPAVTQCYDQILELIQSRELTPVTLDEMFGTARPTPIRMDPATSA